MSPNHALSGQEAGDQQPRVTPFLTVAATPARDGQTANVTHVTTAVPRPAGLDLADYIEGIVKLWRRCRDHIRAHTALTNLGKQICRNYCDGNKEAGAEMFEGFAKLYAADGSTRGPLPADNPAFDHCQPLLLARLPLEAAENALRAALEEFAGQLPPAVRAFVDANKGFTLYSLARLIGEAGDLARYPNPAKLWKRMGLAVIDGERQRKIRCSCRQRPCICGGNERAVQHGYSPQRRSVSWQVTDTFFRAQGKSGGKRPPSDWRLLYERHKDRLIALGQKPAVAHKRARRILEKQLLLALWRAWNDAA